MNATARAHPNSGRPLTEAPPPSTRSELDAAVEALQSRKATWAITGIVERLILLEEMINGFSEISAQWSAASCAGESLPLGTPQSGEEWVAGPYLILRNLRLLRDSLVDIRDHGQPRIPGPIKTRPNGQVTAQVFPCGIWDRLLFPGVTAEVWMEPGVEAEKLAETQAQVYRQPDPQGGVALVLGAGNVSSIGPTDALYKFFVENRVVLYKMHPLNAYLGPLIEQAFSCMVERGFLAVVYGGAEEGAYLCDHPGVEEIHITGSHHTVEAIVFGSGEEGQRRKEERKPRLTKPLSSELGNVSGVIVVPGPWTSSDIEYQAENLVSSLTNNAGFNCNATRMVIQHSGWNQRRELLDALRRRLKTTPNRVAYYPGAEDRFDAFLAAHPEAETYGNRSGGELPWALIPQLDPTQEQDICFQTEAFCSVFGETALEADNPADFLNRAVEFANDVLWGTLNVTLLIHPASLRDPEVRDALNRALESLRFGTVSVNHWAAVGFGLMSTTWGAFPGHDLYDIRSGSGVVHNTFMFERAEKSVLQAPFKTFPKPPWFVSHGSTDTLGERLANFEAEPSVFKLPAVFWHALRG
ncbi:MAG: aldehyde dehydrogenase family protein [Deltaproteobacteria bacterium]|nr:aldehyde dehydrogenase family protein [Deltaproteobacteria bacterium]